MGKGINLEEFKSQLDTNAQKQCAVQEKIIKKSHGQIEDLQKCLKDRDWAIEVLQKRCFAQSFGALCLFCNFKITCTARKKKEGHHA